MPAKNVPNPRTPEQQAHRMGFGQIARLSSDLKELHAIGLHKENLRSRHGARRRTTFDTFRRLNRNCFTDGSVDYPRLIVSKGPLASPDITAVRLVPDGTLTIRWSNDFFPGNPADQLLLAAYCPALRACHLADPTPRAACGLATHLPAPWLRSGPVHLYAFYLGDRLLTSNSIHIPLPSPTAATPPADPTSQPTDPTNPHVGPTKREIDPINMPGDPINRTPIDPINMPGDPINRTPVDPINPSHNDPAKAQIGIANPLPDDPTTLNLYRAVLAEPTLTYSGYAQRLGISEATVKRRLQQLKACGLLLRQGPNKTGHWLPPLPPADS